jgi:hypothetical protein
MPHSGPKHCIAFKHTSATSLKSLGVGGCVGWELRDWGWGLGIRGLGAVRIGGWGLGIAGLGSGVAG